MYQDGEDTVGRLEVELELQRVANDEQRRELTKCTADMNEQERTIRILEDTVAALEAKKALWKQRALRAKRRLAVALS